MRSTTVVSGILVGFALLHPIGAQTPGNTGNASLLTKENVVDAASGGGSWTPTAIGRGWGPLETTVAPQPNGVAVDSPGNVFVADTFNSTIRQFTSAGVVRTLAGLAGSSGSADGPDSTARFNTLSQAVTDTLGNVYIVDPGNAAVPLGNPPVITSPLVAGGTSFEPFVYQFEAEGATSLSVTNLPPGLAFDTGLSAITGAPDSAGVFPVGLSASNSAGITNETLNLGVQPAPTPPEIISTHSETGRVGQFFTMHIITRGGSPAARLSASGLPPGLSADAVTGIISGTVTVSGSFAVTLTVTDGSATKITTLQLTFSSDQARPVIISQDTASLSVGQPFSYTISAPSSADPSDPTTFTKIGGLPNGLSFDPVNGVISGTYPGLMRNGDSLHPNRVDLGGGTLIGNIQLFGTNSHGTSTIQLLFLAAPTGAVNISTRLLVGTGDNVLIGGFIIQGNAPKVALIRALGPSLTNLGVPNALLDPTLELHDNAGHVIYNDNWRDTQQQIIQQTAIPPADGRESAILTGLDQGLYTAIVRGKNDTTGIALVEAYDLGTGSLDPSGNAKLANISTRGFVDTGDNVIIGGFIIRPKPPATSTRVLVRAIGPSLPVPGALGDPTLELHDGNGALIVSNDNWRSDQEAEIIATTIPPSSDLESAIVRDLTLGNYTAIVIGKDNTTGVALVEVYALQ